MNLHIYYRPMACSLAARIVAAEAGLAVTFVAVNLVTGKLADGRDLSAQVPRGQVPALRRADGSLLMESAAVLHYLAAQAPAGTLLAAPGTEAYLRTLECLSFVGAELHKRCLYPYYNRRFPPACREQAERELVTVLTALEPMLKGRPAWRGPDFGIADAYLLWALLLAQRLGAGLAQAPAAAAYLEQMLQRPAVADSVALEMAEARQMGR